jgi:hypothetical protein
MKVIKNYLLITLLLVGSILSAQEQKYVLTLAQAREYALQHNRTLLIRLLLLNKRNGKLLSRGYLKLMVAWII